METLRRAESSSTVAASPKGTNVYQILRVDETGTSITIGQAFTYEDALEAFHDKLEVLKGQGAKITITNGIFTLKYAFS
jgi:hypothetical protein